MEAIKGLYILEGKKPVPCTDPVEWAKELRNIDRRRVDSTEKNDVKVSTVFLGADLIAAFSGGDPVLFETRVFGGPLDEATARYLTWEKAEVGHKDMCKKVFGEEV